MSYHRARFLGALTTTAGLSRTPPSPATAKRNKDAKDMNDALQGISGGPEAEREAEGVEAADEEGGGCGDDEGGVPGNVERDDGVRVSPVDLSVFNLLRCSLPHRHRRLPHPSPAGARQPDHPGRVAEPLRTHR
uniref:Uncharacterized protein n=1 Tax=Opuntia streptacantha TaxID=393608 RepID=A0A7C9ET96_OPUST